MILAYALCCVPVAPIRAEANHRAEQVSQLLFGEKVEVLFKDDHGWLYICCEWDGYVGWIKEGQVIQISLKEYRRPLKAFSGGTDDFLIGEAGKTLLSPGSSLFGIKRNKFLWLLEERAYKGKKIYLDKIDISEKCIHHHAKQFLGAPYLWGGRNLLGIDCSGFSQIVYKLLNYKLPRDASQQALKGELVSFLQEAKCGDLAFFDNEEGKIVHVGILLTPDTIIHATETTGGVVIDKIDNGGIISTQRRMRTHNLRLIKRYF